MFTHVANALAILTLQYNLVRRSPASRRKTISFAGRRPHEAKQPFPPVIGLTLAIQFFSPVAGLTKQDNSVRRSPASRSKTILFRRPPASQLQYNRFRRSPASRSKTIFSASRRPHNCNAIVSAGHRPREAGQSRSPVAGLTKQTNPLRRSSASQLLHNPFRRSPASRSNTIPFAGRRLHEAKQSVSPVAGFTKQSNLFRRNPASIGRRLIALRTWERF